MKTLPILLATLLMCMSSRLSFAQYEITDTESKISKVTVFLSGAQIERKARVSLKPGEQTIRLSRLSHRIDPKSIQVKLDGEGIVLSVSHEKNFLEEGDKDDKVEALYGKRKRYNRFIQRNESYRETLNEEKNMLLANKKIGGTQELLDAETLRDATTFFRERLQEINNQILELKISKDSVIDELELVNLQLKALNAKKKNPSSDILINVQSDESARDSLTLTYLVDNSGWLPAYDLRVEDITQPLELTYKAIIHQQTGVDWEDVKLVVSTANPDQSGSKPVVEPWKLAFYRNLRIRGNSSLSDRDKEFDRFLSSDITGKVVDETGAPLSGATVIIKGTTIGVVTDNNGAFSLPFTQNAQELVISYIGMKSEEIGIDKSNLDIVMRADDVTLDEVVVSGYSNTLGGKVAGVSTNNNWRKREESNIVNTLEVDQTISKEFEIEKPYTIPSDNKQYTVRMVSYEVPANYSYYCAPKYDPDAFLTASIKDWAQYGLLSGTANLYYEGTYLGQSVFDTRSPEDSLIISLGRDKNVLVQRENIKDFSERKTFGSQIRESRQWEITVRNNKSVPIQIVIEDQFPISTDKDIQINYGETDDAKWDEEDGILKWELDLQPSGTEKRRFNFEVKYPKGKKLWLD